MTKSESAPKSTAGQRLIEALSQPDDTYSVKTLIERAGQTVNWLERLDALINGDQREWLRLSLNGDTVEVVVNDPIQKASKLQNDLRYFLAEIFRQRAKLPAGDDGDDDVTSNL